MADNSDFIEAVYGIVRDIPLGSVLTYGRVALLAGKPQNSRLVGRLMSNAPQGLPAHRVVNSTGRTVLGWDGQRTLLEEEGVGFKENGCVDLSKYLWGSE